MNASFQQTLIFFLAVSPEKSNQISLDHENLGIYSQLDGKSKIWFLTFLNVYVSCIERDRFWSHSFNLQNLCILQTRMDQSGEGGGGLMSAKNLRLQQFRYMQLKVHVSLWLRVFSDSALFWYFNPQYLVSCCSDPYKTCYFLKKQDEVFQMDVKQMLY